MHYCPLGVCTLKCVYLKKLGKTRRSLLYRRSKEKSVQAFWPLQKTRKSSDCFWRARSHAVTSLLLLTMSSWPPCDSRSFLVEYQRVPRSASKGRFSLMVLRRSPVQINGQSRSLLSLPLPSLCPVLLDSTYGVRSTTTRQQPSPQVQDNVSVRMQGDCESASM
jgi:hypothetical protein